MVRFDEDEGSSVVVGTMSLSSAAVGMMFGSVGGGTTLAFDPASVASTR